MSLAPIDAVSSLVTPDASTWPLLRFGEFVESISERVDNPSAAGVDRYVGLEHLDPGSLRIQRWGSPGDVEATKLRFHPGDIIFGRRRAYQRKLGVAEFDGICSAHALVLRARPDLVRRDFLPFFLQSDTFCQLAEAISVGSLSPTINWRTLAEQRFRLPPLDLQARLAQLFRAFDRTIWAYHDAASTAARTTVAAATEVTTDGTTPLVELRECLLDVSAGKSPSGASRPANGSEVGVLKVSAVGDGEFLPHQNKVLLDRTAFVAEAAVREGDLLFSRANTSDLVGRVCVATDDFPNLMLSDKTLRLRVNEARVNKAYLALVLRLPFARQQMRVAATGTGGAMKNISQKKLRELRVALPSRQMQLAIVRAHEEGVLLVSALRDQALSAHEMKRLLLARIAEPV